MFEESFQIQLQEAFARIGYLEECYDMLCTPKWKRAIFWLNGWPYSPTPIPASEQKWRPWHRWRGRRDH